IMSVAYARAFANDALWLQFEAPHAEIPVERFEAESMTVLARDKCATSRQKMDEWGARMWRKVGSWSWLSRFTRPDVIACAFWPLPALISVASTRLSTARLSNRSSTSIVVESPRRVRWSWAATTSAPGLT